MPEPGSPPTAALTGTTTTQLSYPYRLAMGSLLARRGRTGGGLLAAALSAVSVVGGVLLLPRPLSSMVTAVVAVVVGLIVAVGYFAIDPRAEFDAVPPRLRSLVAVLVSGTGVGLLIWFALTVWIPLWLPALGAGVLAVRSVAGAARCTGHLRARGVVWTLI